MGNFLTTLILLSRFEHSFGTIRCIVIYLVTAVGGNMFTALLTPHTLKAGASVCLYGLLGALLGYLIINWKGLNKVGSMLKNQLICTSVSFIIFTVVLSFVGTTKVDFLGHLGGFISGLFICGINPTIQDGRYEKTCRIMALTILILFLMSCFGIFYTSKTLDFYIL